MKKEEERIQLNQSVKKMNKKLKRRLEEAIASKLRDKSLPQMRKLQTQKATPSGKPDINDITLPSSL